MSGDPKDPVDPPEKDPVDPPEDDPKDPADPPEDDPEKDPKDPPKDPEVQKAQRRRDAALSRAQKAEEALKAMKEKYEPEKADPVVVANRRLVAAESRVVMTAAGITEAADQKVLQGFLDLDSITVEEDGTVDSDTIQERLESLKAIFGKTTKVGPRVPRTDPRDRGGERPAPRDAATQRRRAMLGLR